MSELRPFALVGESDQWLRCAFETTAFDRAAGTVELAWKDDASPAAGLPRAAFAGVAFDNECRVYHSAVERGCVERAPWQPSDVDRPTPIDLFATDDAAGAFGDFATPIVVTPLAEPCGLAVDVNDRLFVAEGGRDRILVYDLWSRRLLRQVVFLPGARPVDLAAHGATIYAVLEGTDSIVQLSARSGPSSVALPDGCLHPRRIAVAPNGRLAIVGILKNDAPHVWLVGAGPPLDFDLERCSDVEWESDDVLVVARDPEESFLRYHIAPGAAGRDDRRPLRAPGYRGDGIVATPQHVAGSARRIGYWSASGFRGALEARIEHERVGRVTTFRLDSHAYQTTWGRLFVDACIPPGTDVRVHCMTLDDESDEEAIARTRPANVEALTLAHPELSPPMPPLASAPLSLAMVAALPPGTEVPFDRRVEYRLHRRESGRELPWSQPLADDPFLTYEAPIRAEPGRFLWVTLELRGNRRRTPYVRSLRAEHPSHDYLRRLPRVFSREAPVASFLQRYLAIFEGFLGEMDARSADRDLLLDPRSAPDEVLPWLASFMGLVLDERWERAPRPGGRVEDARRAAIRAVVELFRYRGTVGGLKQFIEIYTGVPIAIIEHFRLRGLGGAVLGDTGTAFSSAVLGGGFRVGGAVGDEAEAPLDGDVPDAFRTHAHRFSVVVPALLDAEQLDVVNHIIEVHRPAHTMFRVCTVDAGMRVGRGLHVELSSVIGTTGGFVPIQLGAAALGRGAIVGRPEEGLALGTSILGNPAHFT